MLTPQQTQELLEIINKNQAILIGFQLGSDFLSEYDKSLLEFHGIDWENLYSPENDSIYTSFHLGMLAQALNDTSAFNKLKYQELKEYISKGKYIPLTEIERKSIDFIKNQTYSDVNKLKGKIFQDINGILNNSVTQEQFLRKEISSGIRDNKTVRDIANEIGRKTGDWSRDFDRIVEFQCNSAYQEGRASMIQKNNEGEDPDVYKHVFTSACTHCTNLYLTKGFGSEPRIFKLSQLRANGTNIGRKTADWKAVVGSTHPYCRCLLREKPKGYKWNSSTQAFDIKDELLKPTLKTPRQKIRIEISGKEFSV